MTLYPTDATDKSSDTSQLKIIVSIGMIRSWTIRLVFYIYTDVNDKKIMMF